MSTSQGFSLLAVNRSGVRKGNEQKVAARIEWHREARDFIKLTAKSAAAVSRAAGMSPSVLHRYLTDEDDRRNPPPERVKAINNAIGTLANHLFIRDHLDATYSLERALEGNDIGLGDLPWVVNINMMLSTNYLKDNWPSLMADYVRGSSKKRVESFLIGLHGDERRRLTEQIKGSVPKQSPFERFRSTCSKNGLDITSWLASESQIAVGRAHDDYRHEVIDALFKLAPHDIPGRNRALGDLRDAEIRRAIRLKEANYNGESDDGKSEAYLDKLGEALLSKMMTK